MSKEEVHSPDHIKVDLMEATQKLEGIKMTILAKQRERTLVSNAASIIFMAVVFNIMCICSMHDLLSRQDLPIFFSDGETRAIVGGQRLITTHGDVVSGEEEK